MAHGIPRSTVIAIIVSIKDVLSVQLTSPSKFIRTKLVYKEASHASYSKMLSKPPVVTCQWQKSDATKLLRYAMTPLRGGDEPSPISVTNSLPTHPDPSLPNSYSIPGSATVPYHHFHQDLMTGEIARIPRTHSTSHSSSFMCGRLWENCGHIGFGYLAFIRLYKTRRRT